MWISIHRPSMTDYATWYPKVHNTFQDLHCPIPYYFIVQRPLHDDEAEFVELKVHIIKVYLFGWKVSRVELFILEVRGLHFSIILLLEPVQIIYLGVSILPHGLFYSSPK